MLIRIMNKGASAVGGIAAGESHVAGVNHATTFQVDNDTLLITGARTQNPAGTVTDYTPSATLVIQAGEYGDRFFRAKLSST